MLKKIINKVFKKKKESFEQFQEHEGGYLYKTPDGDYMLFKKEESKTSPDKTNS